MDPGNTARVKFYVVFLSELRLLHNFRSAGSQLFLPPITKERKNIWVELQLNPGSLVQQVTTLTNRWLLGQVFELFEIQFFKLSFFPAGAPPIEIKSKRFELTPVVDADSALEQRQHVLDLRQRPVLLRQNLHRVLEHLVDQTLLFGWNEMRQCLRTQRSK